MSVAKRAVSHHLSNVTPSSRPGTADRAFAWLPFVASAGLVAFALHLALDDPTFAGMLAVGAAALFIPAWLQRKRMRKLLGSGDVDAVLQAWEGPLERVPHPRTMAPLITATALAAHGQVERARNALQRAQRGPAWEAAIEHRLLIDTLLEVFDGDREYAVSKASSLADLPLPPSPFIRGRVAMLRAAMGAFARAFAHRCKRGDIKTLLRASEQNPLVRWPMRYAAAVAFIDSGQPGAARGLLSGAPAWPAESALAAFHTEIEAVAETGSGS